MRRLGLLAVVFSAFLFVACGDDSSSVFPDAVGDLPSSSAKSDDAPASSGDNSSGSSVKSSTGGKSSAKSSSSVKSSSSTGSKSSSSVGLRSSVSSSVSQGSSSASLMDCSDEGEIIHMTDRQTGKDVMYICQDGFYVPYIRSSSSAKSSNSRINLDSLYNSKKSYGEFVDPRDGQKYRTITIEFGYDGVDSITLFATNLNYGKQIELATTEFDDNITEKYCYKDDPWYCDNGFGGLYSWSEAMGLPKACDSVWTGTTPACPDSIFPGVKYKSQWERLKIHGACPENWHVMNEDEWRSLMGKDVTGTGYAITSKVFAGRESTANGTGFSAVYGGIARATSLYENIRKYGIYHLAFEYEAGRHKSVVLSNDDPITYNGIDPKKDGLSVRCVKDY